MMEVFYHLVSSCGLERKRLRIIIFTLALEFACIQVGRSIVRIWTSHAMWLKVRRRHSIRANRLYGDYIIQNHQTNWLA